MLFADKQEKFATGEGVLHLTHRSDKGGAYSALIRYQPADIDGDNIELKELLAAQRGGVFKSYAKDWDVTTEGVNKILLKSKDRAQLDRNKAQRGEAPAVGDKAQDYLEYYRVIDAAKDLQEAISRRQFSVIVNDKGVEETVNLTAGISGTNIFVQTNPQGKPSEEPHDPHKIALFNAIIEKLIPIAGKNIEQGGVFSYQNYLGNDLKFTINSEPSTTIANKILASITAKLEELQEEGVTITGDFVEKQATPKPPALEIPQSLNDTVDELLIEALKNPPKDVRPEVAAIKLRAEIMKELRKSLGIPEKTAAR